MLATTLLRRAVEWQALTYGVGIKAKSNKDAIGVASVDYLMYSGYVQLAYHWLRMEVAANKGLSQGGDQEPDFYKAKQQTSNFVFDNILPRTASLRATMFTPVESVMDMEPKNFSFDHALA